MPLDLTDDESTLIQVMAWCRKTTTITWAKIHVAKMASLGLNELKLPRPVTLRNVLAHTFPMLLTDVILELAVKTCQQMT